MSSNHMSTGITDKPIGQLNDDKLSVKSYAGALAKFISSCDTPMTIALQGSWGSGKTSMMHLIAEHLKDSALCIEFNTWQYSQFDLGERLPIVFYEALIEKLEKAGEEKRSQKVQEIAGICKQAARAVVTLGAGFAGIGDAVAAVEEQMKKGNEVSVVQTIENLRSGLEQLVENRCSQGKDRVVIFVDDLDRLSPQRAVELMEVMKIVVECKNCVFVLAIDYDVVLRGIKDKYGADFADSKGRSFFDKLIQVPVTVPTTQYEIDGYIRGLLDSVCDKELYPKGIFRKLSNGRTPFSLSDVSYLISLSVEKNPRSIKRLFNLYSLCFCMISGKEQRPNPAVVELLLPILCLRICFEDVYECLRLVVSDSKELQNFFACFGTIEDNNWVLGEDASSYNRRIKEASKKALEENPWLAARLKSSLENYPVLRHFMCRLYWIYTNYFFCDCDPGDSIEEFLGYSGYCLSGLYFDLASWMALEQAVELSSATSLGLKTAAWSACIPEASRDTVLTKFLHSLKFETDVFSVTHKTHKATPHNRLIKGSV